MPRTWSIPEGLRVLPDGSWRTGGLPVVHGKSLRYLKERLVFEDDGAFVADGPRRMAILIEGPALEVAALTLDPAAGSARVMLDDGSSEPLSDGAGAFFLRVGARRIPIRT